MLEYLSEEWAVALIGALGGVCLGLAARLGRFCTLGAIEDALYSSSHLRLHMWGLAIGVAMLGSFLAIEAGWVTLSDAVPLAQSWNPLACILGGLMFGYGMAIAGNCGFGALARLGGGDIRAFVIVLIIGIAAYVMASGPLAPLRIWLFPVNDAAEPHSLAYIAAQLTGLRLGIVGAALGLIVVLASLASKSLREDPAAIFWASLVGATICTGWLGTSYVATHGFAATQVTSHTFSTPVGDTLLYLMLSSGLTVSFGMGSVAGVVAGAAIGSLWKGQFRWEACDDPRELKRQMVGAWLMGFGAVLSVGCSIGQGLSAMSLLAFSAPVTLLSIFVGARLGLRQLVEGFAPQA